LAFECWWRRRVKKQEDAELESDEEYETAEHEEDHGYEWK
jgi:hypothetical protein